MCVSLLENRGESMNIECKYRMYFSREIGEQEIV